MDVRDESDEDSEDNGDIEGGESGEDNGDIEGGESGEDNDHDHDRMIVVDHMHKYVPDGEFFAPILTFNKCQTSCRIKYSWTPMDAESIHTLLNRDNKCCVLVPLFMDDRVVPGNNLFTLPPVSLIYYAFIAPAAYIRYYGLKWDRIRSFRNAFRKMMHRYIRDGGLGDPIYFIKIRDGIVTPFDQTDERFFKYAPWNYPAIYAGKVKYDPLAPK
jgi:hypothetical protein